MKSKKPELVPSTARERANESRLVQELKHAKLETVKYVNKFLEAQEKWEFINLILKKLNSIRDKQKLCETICENFLKLCNAKLCTCCLFNQDNFSIEYKDIIYGQDIKDKKAYLDFIEKIDLTCSNLLEQSVSTKEILKYFDSISEKTIIALPILHNKIFSGYFMIVKEDKNFKRDNIHFINIFPEHIALILENLSLYEEFEQNNKRKMEFLAGISHEFKTPLNSIIGFSEIMRTKSDNMAVFKYIDKISQSSLYLLALIDDVLDFTKSQFKKIELNYSNFKPKDEIIQIILALDGLRQEKNIDLKYTLVDVKLSADLKRFKQLIYNLLSNAIKFNKHGGEINIISYIKDDKFFFEIEDTGDGISKKDYNKIFDFFTQVNRNELKRQSGSGIGLAFCKMIIEAHKGEINFKSQFKKGSCFWFALPLKNIL